MVTGSSASSIALGSGRHAIIFARALAISTCPEPKEHPEVQNCRFKPLGNEAAQLATRQLMLDVLPGWLQEHEGRQVQQCRLCRAAMTAWGFRADRASRLGRGRDRSAVD